MNLRTAARRNDRGAVGRWTVVAVGLLALLGLIGITLATTSGDDASGDSELVTRSEAALDRAGISGATVAEKDGLLTVTGVDAADSGRIPDVLAGVEGVDGIEVKALTGESAADSPDDGDPAESDPDSTDPDGLDPASKDPDSKDASGEFLATAKLPKKMPDLPLPDGVERAGVYQGGKLFLVGAVPSYDDANRRISAAQEILGEDNVYNTFEIDESTSVDDDGVIIVAEPFVFPAESAKLPKSFYSLADLGVAMMTRFDSTEMTITGHTDTSGDKAANKKLSKERAEAFKSYLEDKGVDGSRVTTEGMGSAEPAFSNKTAANRARNRRIEVSLKGLLLGE